MKTRHKAYFLELEFEIDGLSIVSVCLSYIVLAVNAEICLRLFRDRQLQEQHENSAQSLFS